MTQEQIYEFANQSLVIQRDLLAIHLETKEVDHAQYRRLRTMFQENFQPMLELIITIVTENQTGELDYIQKGIDSAIQYGTKH